jgi:hypothetical protein
VRHQADLWRQHDLLTEAEFLTKQCREVILDRLALCAVHVQDPDLVTRGRDVCQQPLR